MLVIFAYLFDIDSWSITACLKLKAKVRLTFLFSIVEPSKPKSSGKHKSKSRDKTCVSNATANDMGLIFYPTPSMSQQRKRSHSTNDCAITKVSKLDDRPKLMKQKSELYPSPTTEQQSPSASPKFSNKNIHDVCRCDLCDFISIEMEDLVEHKKEAHATQLPVLAECDYDPKVDNSVEYKCTLCGLSDLQLSVIRQHITETHEGRLRICERVTHRRGASGFKLVVESVRVYRN